MSHQALIDETKLNDFMEKVLVDIGAAASSVMVLIGDQLGLYKIMAEVGPLSSDQLAKYSNTTEIYVREWLGNQAAAGYVSYDPQNEKYFLSPEQAYALAN